MATQAVGSIGARGRGKHTTRNVTLLPLRSGGLVADSPGFNQPGLENVAEAELHSTFPEIAALLREHGRCARPPQRLHAATSDAITPSHCLPLRSAATAPPQPWTAPDPSRSR